jgi:hypothetical protein
MRLEMESEERRKINPEHEAILEEYQKLRHRPLDLPDGHLTYLVKTDRIDFIDHSSDSNTTEVVWSFSRTAPPSTLLTRGLEDRDLPNIFTQIYSANIPGSLWIPLTVLWTFQTHAELETRSYRQNCFYCYVSRRWLSTDHPDPTGTQSRFIAWQIFSHLYEAVRVTNMRGLDTPRKFNMLLGFTVDQI